LKLLQEWGEEIKENDGGVGSSMMYFISYVMNFCKCRNVAPPSKIKKKFQVYTVLLAIIDKSGSKINYGHTCSYKKKKKTNQQTKTKNASIFPQGRGNIQISHLILTTQYLTPIR
jgi:hypothetical protein